MNENQKQTVNILVPELGESVLDATVSEWLKQEGESVAAGEALVELETDKVNLQVSATRAGTLEHIERREREDVRVGDVLGVIRVEQNEPAGQAPKPAEGQKTTATTGPGEDRKAGEAPRSDGDRKKAEAPKSDGDQQMVKASARIEEAVEATGDEKATPVARRMASERGVSLSAVHGSGPGGRVTKNDLESFLAEPQEKSDAPAAVQEEVEKPQSRPAQPQMIPAGRPEERMKLSRRRRTIASRLVEAQHTAAMLTTFNEVDMTAVMDLRKRRNEAFQARYGIKLGVVSFFIKAAIGALKGFPLLNAELQGEEIVIKHYYDIGVAIGAAEGLVVPVIRDADRLSFAEIEQRIKEYAEKSEAGTLTLEDLRGGTFTITNGGVYGSLMSTPILTPPQVGILGLHKIEKRPVAIDDQVVIRQMMYLALSYDHRIVDGREAVQFLSRIKELVEDPENLLLGT